MDGSTYVSDGSLVERCSITYTIYILGVWHLPSPTWAIYIFSSDRIEGGQATTTDDVGAATGPPTDRFIVPVISASSDLREKSPYRQNPQAPNTMSGEEEVKLNLILSFGVTL